MKQHKQHTQPRPLDFILEEHGSVHLLRPLNAGAKQWLDENVTAEDWQWFGGACAAEPRCVPDVLAGIEDAGLNWTAV